MLLCSRLSRLLKCRGMISSKDFFFYVCLDGGAREKKGEEREFLLFFQRIFFFHVSQSVSQGNKELARICNDIVCELLSQHMRFWIHLKLSEYCCIILLHQFLDDDGFTLSVTWLEFVYPKKQAHEKLEKHQSLLLSDKHTQIIKSLRRKTVNNWKKITTASTEKKITKLAEYEIIFSTSLFCWLMTFHLCLFAFAVVLKSHALCGIMQHCDCWKKHSQIWKQDAPRKMWKIIT